MKQVGFETEIKASHTYNGKEFVGRYAKSITPIYDDGSLGEPFQLFGETEPFVVFEEFEEAMGELASIIEAGFLDMLKDEAAKEN